MKILMINGLNTNAFGYREPHLYGRTTLKEIEERMRKLAQTHKVEFQCYQSNHQGDIIDKFYEARERKVDGVIFNPGGLTHHGEPLRDTLFAVQIPTVEVHQSNIWTRSPVGFFDHIGSGCIGQVTGFRAFGYDVALLALLNHLQEKKAQ
jgi:3-dehydroquinate dehydratase II